MKLTNESEFKLRPQILISPPAARELVHRVAAKQTGKHDCVSG